MVSTSAPTPYTAVVPSTRARARDAGTVAIPEIVFGLIDIAIVAVNWVGVFYARFSAAESSSGREFSGQTAQQHMGFLLLYSALVVLACTNQRLYKLIQRRSAVDESLAVTKAVLLATLLLTVFIYLSGAKTISRLVVGFAGVANVVALIGWRLVRRLYVRRRLAQGFGTRNVLIVGAGDAGRALAHYLGVNRSLGFVVKGFIASKLDQDGVIGDLETFSSIARSNFIDDVFITIPSERHTVKELALAGREHHVNVHVIPDLYDGLGWGAPLDYVGDFPVLALHRERIPDIGLALKRLLDIVASAAGLILLLPSFAAIAAVIKIDSRGPIFYRAARVGNKGREFACLKFRTMIADADELRCKLQHLNERDGILFKVSNDPRVTRVGRVLRKYSLDELPQLWNVLTGEMSMVGPRPPIPGEYKKYSPHHLRRLDVRPGITGLWQIKGRRDPSFTSYVALDLEYIENWSFWLDIKILLMTVPEVLRGGGV